MTEGMARSGAPMTSARGKKQAYLGSSPQSPWSTDDRQWFARNPTRAHRLRPPLPQEAEQHELLPTIKEGYGLRVIIRQVEPGARIRQFFYLNADLPDPSGCEFLCHALFDAVISGEELPPPRQIAERATVLYEAAKNGARA